MRNLGHNVGIFKRILSAFGWNGEDTGNDEPVKDTRMSENSDTLIFGDGEPDMNTSIGFNGENRMSPSMIRANSQINNDIKVGDAIGARRNRQMPMSAPASPMQQPRQMPPQPMGYQQPQQQYYQQPMRQQPQQQYYQQPMMQQYQQPMYQPQPEMQDDQDMQSNEPFYERVLVNNTYHLYVDLPGVKKQGLSVQYVNSEVVVSGQRTSMVEVWKSKLKGNKGKKPVFEPDVNIPDYLLGKFKFSFYFPLSVDETTVKADFEDGILHVSMELRATATGVNVSIA